MAGLVFGGECRFCWRCWLEGSAGLEAAGHVLGLPRSDMGSTAQGAGCFGAQHTMAVNETVLAFVLGGAAPDALGGVGTVTDWATEVEFTLPGGGRCARTRCGRRRRSGCRC
ncbi:hypothetical protein ACIRYZ_37955 [Kitasatospora sp. NPDC101155]|uniref:hypothetical protein n=1 Tax=Kitasatospora sp. NPDC101155 TaxID=3364097 RepID=UPI0038200001